MMPLSSNNVNKKFLKSASIFDKMSAKLDKTNHKKLTSRWK